MDLSEHLLVHRSADVKTWLQVIGCTPQELEQQGRKMVEQKPSFFNDLQCIIEHPLFVDFSNKYFNTWKSIQVLTQLFHIYVQMDKIGAAEMHPYEKLACLKDIVVKGYVCGEYSSNQISMSSQLSLSKGIEIYQTDELFKDVADIMEYDLTRTFIQKYFLDWDTGDLVSVLIKLYECFNECTNLGPMQKMGLLHVLISNTNTRQLLSNRISEWKLKTGSSTTTPDKITQ